MPLPPLLLERLKRRGIIQEAPSSSRDSQKQDNNTPCFSGLSGQEQDLELTDETGESLDQEQEEIIAENYSDDDEDGNDDDEGTDDREDQDNGQDFHEDSSDETVFAADLDNPSRLSGRTNKEDTAKFEQVPSRLKDESVIGCPNKYNIYHECGQYCIDNYGKPESTEPTLEQRKQLALILRTYPMSSEWTVVYDPGVRTFYFWNIISNLVSWLPPGMNGFISISADQMRKTIREIGLGQPQDTLE